MVNEAFVSTTGMVRMGRKEVSFSLGSLGHVPPVAEPKEGRRQERIMTRWRKWGGD